MKLAQKFSKKLVSIYPPYRGAGIKVRFSPDGTRITSEMKLRWYNRNYMGTHFGGSLYSMCDPHFMWLLIDHLGPDYIIWDRSATIHFKKPGKGRVRACFHIPGEEYQEIRSRADRGETVYPLFKTEVIDKEGNIVAIVEKELYVKKKARDRTLSRR